MALKVKEKFGIEKFDAYGIRVNENVQLKSLLGFQN